RRLSINTNNAARYLPRLGTRHSEVNLRLFTCHDRNRLRLAHLCNPRVIDRGKLAAECFLQLPLILGLDVDRRRFKLIHGTNVVFARLESVEAILAPVVRLCSCYWT